MKKQEPAADVILRELLKELVKETQDPGKIIPVEEVKPEDSIAYLCEVHNVKMVCPVEVGLMKVNEISKSPVLNTNLYHVITEIFAGFQTDCVTGIVYPRKLIYGNLTVINPDIGVIVRATEDQIKTAYDAISMLKKGN